MSVGLWRRWRQRRMANEPRRLPERHDPRLHRRRARLDRDLARTSRPGRVSRNDGDDEARRLVIVVFPTLEQAKTFYNSPEYEEAKAARAGAADGQFVVIDGI